MSFFQDINKILKILNPKEKTILYLLTLFAVLIAALQAIAISSIVPFINLVMDQNLVTNNKLLNFFYIYFDFESHKSFSFASGLVVFILLTIANVLGYILYKFSVEFLSYCNTSISCRLLEHYTKNDFEFFINSNSSEILKNIVSEVQLTIFNYLQPFIDCITKLFLVLGIFLMILIYNPMITLISLGLFLCGYSLSYIFTNRLSIKLGEDRLKIDTNRFSFLTELLRGIKEIKLSQSEKFFVERFKNETKKWGDIVAKQASITVISRHVIETIIYGGIVFIIILSISIDLDIKELLPIFFLFCIAGFKLIPSIQSIYASILRMRYFSKSLNIIYELKPIDHIIKKNDFRENKKNFSSIKLENIFFNYKGKSKEILKDINFIIKKNQKIGIVGKTGAGKSTLINVILGLLKPTKGTIKLNDQILKDENFSNLQSQVGHISQDLFFLNGTVKENIFFGKNFNDKNLSKLFEISLLNEFLPSSDNNFNYHVGENASKLSGGQKQRLAFARAIIKKPSVLIVDEGSNALDSSTEDRIFKNIMNYTNISSLIIISHRLKSLINCDVIYVLMDGQIVDSGTYHKLLHNNEFFKNLIKYE